MADEIRKCADLDERLAAYVDGEDTTPAHRAVDAHLAGCPPCREDAVAESAARTIVRGHKRAISDRAPDALRARCAKLSAAGARLPAAGFQLRKWVPMSLAATLVLAVAGVFLFGLKNPAEALAASLAADHIKCFNVEGTAHATQPAIAEQAWQQDQGWPIGVPSADASQQLKLCGVRRCFTSDGRSAHIMYTWRGAPLSVYVLQKETDRDRVMRMLGTQAVIWRANQRTYAVVAADDTRDLTQIVDYMKARVR